MTEARFKVVYQLCGDQQSAWDQARALRLEQTVEVEETLLPQGFIRDQIVGNIEHMFPIERGYEVTISYAMETSAYELTQLLNLIFGNSSLKKGIRVKNLALTPSWFSKFPGPRFGIAGLRQLVGVKDKPLLCTALKPMGKTPNELAEVAYQFALGGIDLIKDDHGLTNQPFCPYTERVEACMEAVTRANQKTGYQCLYVPNATAPFSEIKQRAEYAKTMKVGGLLIAPGLVGFDTMHTLAQEIQLPIIAHPAWLGSMVINPESGFSHGALFGQLQRLAGADASVYPNYGGRFGFSQTECQSIAQACREDFGHFRPIFPAPGGGMTLEKIPEMLTLYGNEVIFLIGGALYSHSPHLVDNARYFLSLVGR